MVLNDPFARMAPVRAFDLTSRTIPPSLELPIAQYSGLFGVQGGEDRSPELSWNGAPAGTLSFAVTAYDPDAPTGSGIWHWAVANLPAGVTHLPEGAGDADAELPGGAICLPGDARLRRYVGAVPPVGDGVHRYFFTVHALDVPHLPVDAETTPATLGYFMLGHVIGRAVLIATGVQE